MEYTDLTITLGKERSDEKINLQYAPPKLTVFGKINDITQGTKKTSPRNDSVYTCGEDHQQPCYS
jgi:hypothetical protein